MIVKKKNRLMSIDTSINNLGVAIWDMSTKQLIMHKLLHPKKDCRNNQYDKSLSMLDQIKEWIIAYTVNHMIVEVPEYWAVGGFEARETGSISKLMFVCGMIYSLKHDMEELQLVVPRGWKGQLPKEVVANRLRDHYLPMGFDMTKIDKNVMDAIGIGHYKLFGSV
jgi:hypothetical protein